MGQRLWDSASLPQPNSLQEHPEMQLLEHMSAPQDAWESGRVRTSEHHSKRCQQQVREMHSQAFPEHGQHRAPSSRAAGMGHLRRDNKGDRPQQGHGLAPLASSVGPCRADTDTCGHCSPRCAFGGSKAREGGCAKMRVGPSSAPSSSPGSMSALPHPRKCPGCGQQLWELPLSPHW